MTCPQTHQIEAYLDGELSREARKEFAKHLDHCAACHAVLTEHKRLLQWTDEMIAESLPDLPEHVIDNLDVDAAWSRFQDKLVVRDTHIATPTTLFAIPTPPQRRWSFMAKTYQKWLVGTTAAVVVLGSLSFPQVQAAASDLLSMFRAEKFETIHMTAQDLEDLQQWMNSGEAGERNLQGLGTVTRLDGSQAPRHFDSLETAKNAGYEVAPAPAGFTVKSVNVQPEFSMQFKLNTAKANGLLKSLGSTVTFDDKLNDQPFTVTFPRQTETSLVSKETDGLALDYSVLKTPHMEAPAGVDLNQLRTTILQLPMIPPHVAEQLARIEDWQNTVPMPYIEGNGNMEKVSVNGNEGIFHINEGGNGAALIWQEEGQLHNLSTKGTTQISDLKSYLLKLAKTFN